MKTSKILLILLLSVFSINSLHAQKKEAFENKIVGFWTIKKMLFVDKSAKKVADKIKSSYENATCIISRDEVGAVSVVLKFKEDTFEGICLTQINSDDAEELFVDVVWGVKTDPKKLKKYGLTDALSFSRVPSGSLKMAILKSPKKQEVLYNFMLEK